MDSLVKVGLSGGINLLDDPTRISDEELVQAKNLVPVKPGILKMRPAVSLSNVAGRFSSNVVTASAQPGNAIPRAVHPVSFPDWPAEYLYAIEMGSDALPDASRLMLGWGTVGYNPLVDGSNPVLTLGTPNVQAPVFATYIDNVYVFNGIETGWRLTSDGSTITATALAYGTGNGDLKPALAAVYRDHFVYGNLASGYENAILISALSDPETVGDNALSANGRYIYVGESDDKIVGMVTVALTAVGSPVDSGLLILKERSAWMLTGLPSEPGVALDLADLTLSRFAFDCGCASNETITRTPNGVMWASQDDVWAFEVGATPRRVGTKIRPALEEGVSAARTMWHAAYADGFYRLACASSELGTPCAKQYWLDIRDGIPNSAREARWWGPQQYKMVAPAVYGSADDWAGTYCMATLGNGSLISIVMDDWNDGLYDGYWGQQAILAVFGAANNRDCIPTYAWTINSAFGPTTDRAQWRANQAYASGMVTSGNQVFELVTPGTSHAATAPVYTAGSGPNVTDNTCVWKYMGTVDMPYDQDGGATYTYIECELRTKVYDFGDPMIRKLFTGAEVSLHASHYGLFEWDVIADQGYSVNNENSEELESYGVIAGIDAADSGRLSRRFQSFKCTTGSGTRFTGNTLQFVFRNQPGYLLVDDYNNHILVGFGLGGGNPWAVMQAVEIPAGYYADYSLLMQGVQAAVDAALAAYSVSSVFDNGLPVATWEDTNDPDGLIGISIQAGDIPGGSSVTLAELKRAGVFFGLGIDTRLASSTNAPQTAQFPVAWMQNPIWEIGEIKLRIRPINRRPA